MAYHPYPSGTVLLLVGTRGGLFLLTSRDRERWNIEVTKLEAQFSRIYYAVFDPRSNYRLFVADNSDISGPLLRYSDDFGQCWRGIQLPQVGGEKVKDIWIIEPGRPQEPSMLYVGTDPACLWISRDHGETWQPDIALLNHPTRSQWESESGTCLHSIIADPTNPRRMWLSIAGAGNLRTDDGGENWCLVNRLVTAQTTGAAIAEVGTGSHRLVQHTVQPETLYLQGREGVFKTRDGGEHWFAGHASSRHAFCRCRRP